MAKAKGGGNNVANRQLYSRASFLYQAAALMATSGSAPASHDYDGCFRMLVTIYAIASRAGRSGCWLGGCWPTCGRLRSRGRSGWARTSSTRCASAATPLLVEGVSCVSAVENKSRDGAKPWADVLVVRCKTCGGLKRFRCRRRGRAVGRSGRRRGRHDGNTEWAGSAGRERPKSDSVP